MTMKNLGKALKARRQEMGLSLKDIASILRIRVISLEKIESDEYDLNDVYVSGYIRLYSKYLGVNIDAEEIIQEKGKSLGLRSSDEYQNDDGIVVDGVPSIRVVCVALIMIVVSVFFLIFFFDKSSDKYDVSYIHKLNLSAQDRVVVKESSQTYVVHTHNAPLVIKANDSVEVTVFDAGNQLLEKIYLRVGEVVPFPVKNISTIVRANIPDAIEISTAN